MDSRVGEDGRTDLKRFDLPDGGFWDVGVSDVARRLLGSAVLCFARSGFHGTTTRDITTAVGLSPASLYVHFPSKETLLFDIIRTGHERTLTALYTQPSTEDLPLRLQQLVATFTEWHARHHTVARICQYELAALTADHYAEILAMRHEINTVFRVAVEAGVKNNSFEVSDVNGVVRAILSLGIDVVRWYRMNGTDSPERLASFYASLALRMVTPERAPQRRGPSRRSPTKAPTLQRK